MAFIAMRWYFPVLPNIQRFHFFVESIFHHELVGFPQLFKHAPGGSSIRDRIQKLPTTAWILIKVITGVSTEVRCWDYSRGNLKMCEKRISKSPFEHVKKVINGNIRIQWDNPETSTGLFASEVLVPRQTRQLNCVVQCWLFYSMSHLFHSMDLISGHIRKNLCEKGHIWLIKQPKWAKCHLQKINMIQNGLEKPNTAGFSTKIGWKVKKWKGDRVMSPSVWRAFRSYSERHDAVTL